MDLSTISWQLVGAVAGGLALGALLGWLFGRRSGEHAARVRALQRELESAREEHGRYRAQVGEHFGRTSDLLRRMTLQYRAVYDHLAEGARSFSPDGSSALAGGLEEAPLPLEAGAGGVSLEDLEPLPELEVDPEIAEKDEVALESPAPQPSPGSGSRSAS